MIFLLAFLFGFDFVISSNFYLGHKSISHMTLKRDKLLILLHPGVVPIDFPSPWATNNH